MNLHLPRVQLNRNHVTRWSQFTQNHSLGKETRSSWQGFAHVQVALPACESSSESSATTLLIIKHLHRVNGLSPRCRGLRIAPLSPKISPILLGWEPH